MSCSISSLDTHETEDETEHASVEKSGASRRSHILWNLIDREMNGTALHRLPGHDNGNSGGVCKSLFGRDPPTRLSMPIDSVVPAYALENGNIFMGFTKCGRYLLSYMSRPCDVGLWNRTGDLTFTYKLNFWLFTPYAKAREIYSIHLFENQAILHDNLLIEIAQWPCDDTKLLVTGRSLNPTNSCPDSLIYVTIATIPETKPCADCSYAPPEEDEEYTEVALFLKPCVRHGLTVHFAHDQVEPYPVFNPKVQLKFKDSVFFNTGNIFHMFTVLSVAPNEESPFKKELLHPPSHACFNEPLRKRQLRCDFWFKNDSTKPTSVSLTTIMKNCSRINANKNELNRFITNAKFTEVDQEENILCINKQMLLLSSLSSANPQSVVPPPYRRLSVSSCESELSIKIDEQGNVEVPVVKSKPSPESSSSSLTWSWKSEANTVLTTSESKATSRPAKMLPPQTRKFFKELRRVLRKSPAVPVPVSTSQNPTSSASFDIFEVNVEDSIEYRSFSSFRKRKLADKKYEFCDFEDHLVPADIIPRRKSPKKRVMEDTTVDENSVSSTFSTNEATPRCETGIQLGNLSPRSFHPASSPCLSPNYNNSAEILRSITNNPPFSTFSLMIPSESLKLKEGEHGTCDEELIKVTKKEVEHAHAKPTFSCSVNCIAKILRCYADTDEADDNMSVRTESDDEYNVTLPFPIALVLNVLGKDSQPLSMLSNSKAKFCPKRRTEILQRSIDIEILCNEVATMICLASGKYFCSCFDYDVAFIDVCPETGSAIALALVLFSATSLKRFNHEKYATYNYDIPEIPGIPDHRKKYEAMFSFMWDPMQERVRILYLGHLTEMQTVPEPWNPTKIMAPHVISVLSKNPLFKMTLRNDMAVTDAQSVYQLKDFDEMITLFRHETNYERQQRLRAEARLQVRNQRVLSSASATTSEDEDGFIGLSIISDISTD